VAARCNFLITLVSALSQNRNPRSQKLFTRADWDVDEELEGGVDDEAEACGADDHVVDVEKKDVAKAETIKMFKIN